MKLKQVQYWIFYLTKAVPHLPLPKGMTLSPDAERRDKEKYSREGVWDRGERLSSTELACVSGLAMVANSSLCHY